MNSERSEIVNLLSTDREWAAYALADLDPAHREHCDWMVGHGAVLLIYGALQPPVLFLHGDSESLTDLLAQVPPGEYQFSCLPSHIPMVKQHLDIANQTGMWRMSLSEEPHRQIRSPNRVRRLSVENLGDISNLVGEHPDAPDAFSPSQLDDGAFYGVFIDQRLVAMSGTHVCSNTHRLAAIGNVFTDPAFRGNGFAALTTQAVVRGLLAQGIETIVLNVARSNRAALKAYQRIGFQPYCKYFEGYAQTIKR